MTRLVQWYVAIQLRNMGWPRPKGLFRKMVVPTQLVDLTAGQALQLCMGLGAGRPALACRAIADAYGNRAWTPESAASLVDEATARTEDAIGRNPGLPPWKALYAEHTMGQHMAEVRWELLGTPDVAMLWTAVGADAAIWALSHEGDLEAAFEMAKRHYEQIAPEAVRAGLEIPVTSPWQSLDDFYGTCEGMVASFESERPVLASIPDALRDVPLIARRIGPRR